MKLSTRTRYSVRAILELAENYGKGPLQLKAIAEHQEISVKYLEQLMAVLKSTGIVRSVRAPKEDMFSPGHLPRSGLAIASIAWRGQSSQPSAFEMRITVQEQRIVL